MKKKKKESLDFHATERNKLISHLQKKTVLVAMVPNLVNKSRFEPHNDLKFMAPNCNSFSWPGRIVNFMYRIDLLK